MTAGLWRCRDEPAASPGSRPGRAVAAQPLAAHRGDSCQQEVGEAEYVGPGPGSACDRSCSGPARKPVPGTELGERGSRAEAGRVEHRTVGGRHGHPLHPVGRPGMRALHGLGYRGERNRRMKASDTR